MSPRRRYLVTTLALLVVAALHLGIESRRERPAPRLWRPASAVMLPARTPTGREILTRGAELALSGEQTARLEALDRAWRAETAGLRAAADEAGEELAAFAGSQGARGASLAEVQRQSARYRELSAELRQRSVDHAGAATAILNDAQRRRLTPGAASHTSGERQ